MSVAATLLLFALAAPADLVGDLYAHRLLFNDAGQPIVQVGLMQGAARVVMDSEDGLRITVAQAGGREETLEVAPRTPFVIERLRGAAGKVEDLWILETLEGEDRLRKRQAAARWADSGLAVEILDVGGVYGVKGTVVDNRAALLVIPARAQTAAAQLALAERLGARPAPLARLQVPPSVELRAGRVRGAAARIAPRGAAPILVHDVEHSVGYADHGFADRAVRGEVAVVPDRHGTLAVVNLVDEDALVAGVLPSEMFARAPLEALKAQAVTARGELFAKIGKRHFADPHLVCSEQHCQVYRGMSAEQPRSNQAAEATRGELAFVGQRLVDSVYSACCGGHTEAADVVWDRPPQSALTGRVDAPHPNAPSGGPRADGGKGTPAEQARVVESSAFAAAASHGAGGTMSPVDMRSDEGVRAFLALPRASAFCGTSSFNQKGDVWRWQRRFTQAELQAAFRDLDVGEIRDLRVEERGPGGRLRALVVEGSRSTARVLRELPVRKRLGNLRSGLFVVEAEREPGGRLEAVTLRGAGFGHGSGMCQQGAIGMAEAGYDYKAILGHYYAGAEVRKVF